MFCVDSPYFGEKTKYAPLVIPLKNQRIFFKQVLITGLIKQPHRGLTGSSNGPSKDWRRGFRIAVWVSKYTAPRRNSFLHLVYLPARDRSVARKYDKLLDGIGGALADRAAWDLLRGRPQRPHHLDHRAWVAEEREQAVVTLAPRNPQGRTCHHAHLEAYEAA